MAVGRSAFSAAPELQLGGGLTITMPPHLGQARIWPIAACSRTFSRDLQVVQVMENKSMMGNYEVRSTKDEAMTNLECPMKS